MLHQRTIQAIQNWGLNKRVCRQTDRQIDGLQCERTLFTFAVPGVVYIVGLNLYSSTDFSEAWWVYINPERKRPSGL